MTKTKRKPKFEICRLEKLKALNERIARFYSQIAERQTASDRRIIYMRKSEQIKHCSSLYIKYYDRTKPNAKIKSFKMRCKNRFCPTCIYFESKKTFKLINDIVNDERMQNMSYIFITLTVKNCRADELSKTIDNLLTGFHKLTKGKRYQFTKRFEGVFRVLECTFNTKTGEFHPHIHCLVAVNKDYFKETKKYLTQSELIEIWQKAINADYKPNVDIRAVKNIGNKDIAEVSKYTVKSSQILNDEVMETYDINFSHRRLKAYTGIFFKLRADILKSQKSEDDFKDYEEIRLNRNFAKIIYRWNCFKSQFRIAKISEDFNIGKLSADEKEFTLERL